MDDPYQANNLTQGCTTFLGQGTQRIIFSALDGQRQNYELKFRESSIKKSIFLNLTSLFIDYSLIFLPSELLRIVISCKIVNSSMKFKFIHKFFLIQEKFLLFFKLLRGPDITRSGAGSGPRVVHPCFTPYRSFIEVCKDGVGVSSTADRERRGPCVSPHVSFRDIILGMFCTRPLLVMNKYIICYF